VTIKGSERWLPVGVVTGNLAVFQLSASCVLSGSVRLSHHWLFPFHEGLLLLKVFLLDRRLPVRTLTVLSLLVLGISVARMETIYLSHHLIHLSMAWALGAAIHRRLAATRSSPWRAFNAPFAVVAAIWMMVTGVVAVTSEIWWGMSDWT